MKTKIVRILFFLLLLLLVANTQAENRPRLMGWGLGNKDFEENIKEAAEIGFQTIIVEGDNKNHITQAVEIAQKYGIEIYACVTPRGIPNWKKYFPDQPKPYQVMTPEQDAAFNFLSAGKNRSIIPYQWGGEPVMENEVLIYKIICPSNQAARKLQKEQIDDLLTISNLKGIAFDGYGYQNYHRCHCDDCERGFLEFKKEQLNISLETAEVEYFRDLLVNWINDLAHYVRNCKANVKTTIHIWPVFAPEPLYGNRLDVDFCGQTAAWYTRWPAEKIAEYSRIITADAQQYHKRQQGVGMIGYYDKPELFPIKEATLVDNELRIMLKNGCKEIQVCGAQDVLENEEVAQVFKKHFGKKD